MTSKMRVSICVFLLIGAFNLLAQDIPISITSDNVVRLTSQGFFDTPFEMFWRIRWISGQNDYFAVTKIDDNPGVWIYDASEVDKPPHFLAGQGRFSSTGSYWVARDEDVINGFSVVTGEIVYSFQSNEDGQAQCGDIFAFSDDDSRLAFTNNDFIEVWGLETWELVTSFSADFCLTSLDINPNGDLIVSANTYGVVSLWDLSTGERIQAENEHMNAASARFVAQGDSVLSRSVDRSIHLWDTVSGDSQLAVWGHSDLISALIVPDGDRLIVSDASSNLEGSLSVVTVWNVQTQTQIVELTLPNDSGDFLVPGHVSIAGSHNIGAFWNSGAEVIFFDEHTGELIQTVSATDSILDAQFVPFSDLFAVWHESGEIEFWDYQSGERIHSVNTEPLRDVIFDLDGARMITTHTDGRIQLWQLEE